MKTRNLLIICIALIVLAIIFNTVDFGDEIAHEVDELSDSVEDTAENTASDNLAPPKY